MSVPKYPVFITDNPRNSRLPTPGVGIWIPLRAGNFATTSPGLSSAIEVGSGHVAQDSPLRYKFPLIADVLPSPPGSKTVNVYAVTSFGAAVAHTSWLSPTTGGPTASTWPGVPLVAGST